MAEEIEVPTEHLHEQLKEESERHAAPWVPGAALSSGLIAVVAAVASLLAGHHANEAMLEQMRATDQWAFYQAKGIKGAVLESKLGLLTALGKEVLPDDRAALSRYNEEQKKIEESGHELEASSEKHMARHTVLARSVTFSQVAIALAAIAVLSRRKKLWLIGLGLGAVGLAFLAQATLTM